MNPIQQVINLQEEKNIEAQIQGIIDLHDFIRDHPDSAVKEIAKFMPPVDARVVSKAILAIEERDRKK